MDLLYLVLLDFNFECQNLQPGHLQFKFAKNMFYGKLTNLMFAL